MRECKTPLSSLVAMETGTDITGCVCFKHHLPFPDFVHRERLASPLMEDEVIHRELRLLLIITSSELEFFNREFLTRMEAAARASVRTASELGSETARSGNNLT